MEKRSERGGGVFQFPKKIRTRAGNKTVSDSREKSSRLQKEMKRTQPAATTFDGSINNVGQLRERLSAQVR